MMGETVEASDVRLTERAARRIAEILKDETGPAFLRVAVLGGGCSGFQYEFKLDQEKSNDDLVIARGGATLSVRSRMSTQPSDSSRRLGFVRCSLIRDDQGLRCMLRFADVVMLICRETCRKIQKAV